MKDKDAESRMEGLFINYVSILRLNGINLIFEKNEKLEVQHC